jgi:hypothetical protein
MENLRISVYVVCWLEVVIYEGRWPFVSNFLLYFFTLISLGAKFDPYTAPLSSNED